MPCTVQLDQNFSVTISSDRQRDGRWTARGRLFREPNGAATDIIVHGEGRTLPAAERRALAEARRMCAAG